MVVEAKNGAVSAPYLRLLLRAAGPVLTWGFFALALLPYVSIRGVADELRSPLGLEGIEGAFFGTAPTRAIQEATYNEGITLLDFPAFVMHLSWFFLPFGWSVVIAFKQRHRMLEFYCWILLTSYLSTLFFLALPVRPPWMEPGIHRILAEHQFLNYASLDDNQFAAFPSLHAALPVTIALFFWYRIEGGRKLAVPIALHGLLISAAVVYLGEHWVIDVLGGWVLASSVATAFVSSRVRSLVHKIHGSPLKLVVRVNTYLMNAGTAETWETSAQPAHSDAESQRAAA